MAQRMWIEFGLGALTLATGCAGAAHQVVPTGHDTYMVASHGTMRWAFAVGNDYCKQEGKEVETISDRETDSGFGKIASAEIEFPLHRASWQVILNCAAPKNPDDTACSPRLRIDNFLKGDWSNGSLLPAPLKRSPWHLLVLEDLGLTIDFG